MRRNRSIRVFGTMLLLFVLATATYAFTANNTFSGDNQAGQGVGVISGYEASNISYTLDSGDPSSIASVTFTLDGAATDVRARINTTAADGAWATCTPEGVVTDRWDCAATQSVNPANELEVVAVN